METPSPQSPENSVPACTTLPTEGWNRGRVDTSGRWSTMPKLASQPSPGWNLGGNWRLPGNRNIQTRHSQYIYIYTNHIYQPTTNQPTTNQQPTISTINYGPSIINHPPVVPSLSQRHGSCRTGQFHLLHQVFGLGRNPQMMDTRMGISWTFYGDLARNGHSPIWLRLI